MKIVKKVLSKLFIFLFLSAALLVTLGPFLWVFFASFQTNREILSFTLGFPQRPEYKKLCQGITDSAYRPVLSQQYHSHLFWYYL